MTTMKVLITGGLGFIGSALIRSLNQRGEQQVTVCDHLDGRSSKWSNLRGLVVEDLVDTTDLNALLARQHFDVIVHLGARTDTREDNLKLLYDLNYRAGQDLFRTAAISGTRFIYASSAATYGNGNKGWSDATPAQNLHPLNAYGFYKNLFDLWVGHQQVRPSQVCGLKFFNVYGPGEAHKGRMASAIYHFYQDMQDGGPIKLFKSNRVGLADGEQKRDFIYIDDVVQALQYVLENRSVEGLLNVGTGTARSFLDVARAVERTAGHPVRITFVDMPAEIAKGYQAFSQADSRRIDGHIQFTSLETGVARYYDFLTQN